MGGGGLGRKGKGKKNATSCSFSQTISSDCSVSLINTVQKVIALIKHLIATLPLCALPELPPPALRRSGGLGWWWWWWWWGVGLARQTGDAGNGFFPQTSGNSARHSHVEGLYGEHGNMAVERIPGGRAPVGFSFFFGTFATKKIYMTFAP